MNFPLFNYISTFTGFLCKLHIPKPLNSPFLWGLKKMLGINLDESQFKLSQFNTINELFTRQLIPAVRPISKSANFIVPCDSKLMGATTISDKESIAIKNINLNLNVFLHTELTNYTACLLSFYLSPKDCHHVFMPTDGRIIAVTHIPGKLFPVSPTLAKLFPNAFIENERVVVTCKTKQTIWYIVFVGALNVGKIHINSCPECQTNSSEKKVTQYNSGFELKKGDPLGYFEMGSSILIIHPKLNHSEFTSIVDFHVKYGRPLCKNF